jgi:hypothetical protein
VLRHAPVTIPTMARDREMLPEPIDRREHRRFNCQWTLGASDHRHILPGERSRSLTREQVGHRTNQRAPTLKGEGMELRIRLQTPAGFEFNCELVPGIIIGVSTDYTVGQATPGDDDLALTTAIVSEFVSASLSVLSCEVNGVPLSDEWIDAQYL